MLDIMIQLLPIFLTLGYSVLVCWFMIVGCEKWWDPFVFALAAPFVFLYIHRLTILLLAVVAITLFYVPIFLLRLFA